MQGSILGPLLFSIYMNSLANISLSRDSTLILYADDIVCTGLLRHALMSSLYKLMLTRS